MMAGIRRYLAIVFLQKYVPELIHGVALENALKMLIPASIFLL
jgi:hypothetical protein